MKNLLEVKASELRLEELESNWPVKTWLRKFWPEKTVNTEALGWECGPARKTGVLERL